ncbi:MAG: flagellar basal body P-ring formation protein FlgA [Nitrospirae bacterium]|nr:flagellar basal body P-ring formation protein FlgA [Nitrospirota bacterium]
MKTEGYGINRSQKPEARSQTVFACLLCSVFCVLSSVVFAFSWSPEDTLKTFLRDNYPWETIEVRNIQVTGSVPDRTPDMIVVEKGPLGNGIFSYIFNDGQKVTVRADVRAFEKVIKSKRPFRKGYVLNEDDIYQSEVEINKMPQGAVRESETIIGKPLKVSTVANALITERMIEKEQVVKKGSRVALLINSQGINITAVGETKEKGYVGMQVRAINVSSRKEVRGVLINENTVRVEL